MTAQEFVDTTWMLITNKLPTFAITDDKGERLMALGNFYIDQWAREPGVDWVSLYDPAFAIGTVTATDTFDLDDEILKLSTQEGDVVRIFYPASTTSYVDYTTILANRLKEYDTGRFVAMIGRTLRFNAPFTSDFPEFGGLMYAPVYLKPEHIELASDEVPIDDPNWLCLAVAADYVKNDVTRKDLRADLVAQANSSMQAMKEENDQAQSTRVYTPWSPLGKSWS